MATYADCNLRMVLLGETGSGKSSTGNTILGRDEFTVSSSSDMSVTAKSTLCKIQKAIVEDKVISLVDTSGMFNESMTEEELQSEIKRCIYMSAPGPHVFLLVVRLDARFTEEEKMTVKWIQENFGEKAMKYTIILFTNEDQLDQPIEQYIKKHKHLKQLVIECKAGYHSLNNKDKNNQTQIKELLKKIDRLIEENGGKHYTNEMYKKAQSKIRKEKIKQMERKKQMEKEMKQKEKYMHQPWKFFLAGRRGSMDTPLDLRIFLLGKTGSGKSATGNTILSRQIFKTDNSTDSVTKSCQEKNALVGKQIISVTDTPGLFDKSVTKELTSEIQNCVYMSASGPHVFLLVIRLDVTITDEEKNAVKWIQENFGEDAVKNTIPLFTHADVLKTESLEAYIRKCEDIQALIGQFGGRYHLFNNDDKENRDQVTQLLNIIDKMVKDNEGEHDTNEMYRYEEIPKIEWKKLKQRRIEYETTALTSLFTTVLTAFTLVVLAAVASAVASGRPAEVAAAVASGRLAEVLAAVAAGGAAEVLAAAAVVVVVAAAAAVLLFSALH